jgi:hypothetical protein
LDPRTVHPADGLIAVTVLAPHDGEAVHFERSRSRWRTMPQRVGDEERLGTLTRTGGVPLA